MRQTHLPNCCQLFIVLEEEAQVLIADVDVCITPKSPVFLLSFATTAEPMAVDLILNLIWHVTHKYARVDVRRAHFCLRALQSREEFCVQQRGLRVFQLVGNVARKAEIRVLVDCTRDKTRDVGLDSKNLWEGVGKRWSGLNGAKVYLSNVITAQINITKMKTTGRKRERTNESLKPNVALAWLRVIWREIFDTFL
jgi:hypothetical protein